MVDALKYNPIFIEARFEIVNNLLALNEFEKADSFLNDMSSYLYSSSQIAEFYRRKDIHILI